MNDKAIFDFLRKKKADWSGNPKAKLTQSEVDEANNALAVPDAVVVAPTVLKTGATEVVGRKAPALAAVIGSVAATLSLSFVPQEEGLEYKAYRDIAGIWTICSGDTKDVHAGLIETPEGCQKRTEMQLVAHAKGMMLCTPNLAQPGRDYQRAATTSLTYNIGIGAYCKSSIDRSFDAGQWVQGCDNFIKWNKATVKGQLKVVRGLDNRRKREIQICGTNLIEGWTPQNLKQRLDQIK